MEFTKEKKAQFFTLLETGRTVTEAADQVGISRNTPYSHAKSDPEFKKRFDEIMKSPKQTPMAVSDLVRKLEQNARKGHTNAIKLLMEYHAGTWPKKQEKEEASKPKAPASKIDELAARRNKS